MLSDEMFPAGELSAKPVPRIERTPIGLEQPFRQDLPERLLEARFGNRQNAGPG
jgi:hypothetical protein